MTRGSRSISAWRPPSSPICPPLTVMPLASPTLQRRAGYRQVLAAWLSLGVAAQLEWDAAEDLFGGGLRDVATLYEYWGFFRMLRLTYSLNDPEAEPPRAAWDALFAVTGKGIEIRLAAGKRLALPPVVWTLDGDKVTVELRYNWTFSGSASSDDPLAAPEAEAGRSVTRDMRPDYTFVLEHDGEHRYVHFDAKYRVDGIWFDTHPDAQLDADAHKENERAGTTKRADLLKMHSYRDAIPGTVGAYVVFPGEMEAGPTLWRRPGEPVAGVGAVPLRPGDASLTPVRVLLEHHARALVGGA